MQWWLLLYCRRWLVVVVNGEVREWRRSVLFFFSRNVVSFSGNAIVVLARCSGCSCRFQVKVAHPWLTMMLPLQMRWRCSLVRADQCYRCSSRFALIWCAMEVVIPWWCNESLRVQRLLVWTVKTVVVNALVARGDLHWWRWWRGIVVMEKH